MKTYLYSLLILCFLMTACQGDGKGKTQDNTATTAPKTETQPAASGQVNLEIKEKLKELLPQCNKVQYRFKKPGMEFTTETAGQQGVLSYYNFISEEEAPQTGCNYDWNSSDGEAIFLSPNGDILLTASFILNNPKCQSFSVVIGKKTYNQKMDPAGLQYLLKFYNIDMQQGAPVAK